MSAFLYNCFLLLVPIFFHHLPKEKIASAHPFYISVTEINHNSNNKTLEISCKMFADDLEQILEKNYKTELDISEARYKATFDKLIPDYIKKHLSIIADAKNAALQYVGYEVDKESVYCYMEVAQVASVKKLTIINSLLHDFNTSQINIMHIVVNNHRQSTKLDYPATQANFTF